MRTTPVQFFIIFFAPFEGLDANPSQIEAELFNLPHLKSQIQSASKEKQNPEGFSEPFESSDDSTYQPILLSGRLRALQNSPGPMQFGPCRTTCKQFRTTIENLVEKYKFSLFKSLGYMGVLGAQIV